MRFAILHPRRRADIETTRRAFERGQEAKRQHYISIYRNTRQLLEAGATPHKGPMIDKNGKRTKWRFGLVDERGKLTETEKQMAQQLAIPPVRATLEQKKKFLHQASQAAEAGKLFQTLTEMRDENTVQRTVEFNEVGKLSYLSPAVAAELRAMAEPMRQAAAAGKQLGMSIQGYGQDLIVTDETALDGNE